MLSLGMHFHHFTLKHLAAHLDQQLVGQRIRVCFSQNRNELVILAESGGLRIGCHTPLTYLVPVDSFAKAKRNVVDLFEEIWRQRIEKIRVVPFERILVVELSDQYNLVCKLHGPAANVILRKGSEVLKLFNQKKEEDWGFVEAAGPFHPENAIASPEQNAPAILSALRDISPIYDKRFAAWVLAEMQSGKSFETAYQSSLSQADAQIYYLFRENNRIRLSLFPPEKDELIRVAGIEKGIGLFMKAHFQYSHYLDQYRTAQRAIEKPHKKLLKNLASYQKSVQQIETERNPEEIGHIIMANLHAIETGEKKVELDDFYQEGSISIKLNPKLSPQDNAQRYYEKHKNRKAKIHYLKAQLAEVEEEVLEAEMRMEAFQNIIPPQELSFSEAGFSYPEMKPLRDLVKSLDPEEKSTNQKRIPFRTFSRGGYDILVGKGAKNNDELSFKYARKEDLWLHAKDVTGSHVIIKRLPGREVPGDVLEYAAQLAAFYSKRKNDSLVAVQYTTRKYIRKRKGDPPGLVAVDREDVIMVEPIRE
ncbi:MAG: NFACT RNA binding domain-containing protein [Bacteroidota bacterium]